MKKIRKKLKYGTLKDKILIVLMLGLICGFSLVIAFCGYIVVSAPEISSERLYKSSSTVIYDRYGNEFAKIGAERRERVSYDELPEILIDAIVATEDSRFFQHNGIDIARFVKASLGQLLGQSNAGGGSTLTMQVSKNTATNPNAHGFAGIKRKFQDIYLSVFVFEKKYTKEQILEFYVNMSYLGSYSYGVEQACQTYFGKSVSELNLPEAATIAGLFQAPYSYDPYAHPVASTNRRNTVLNLMYRHGYITEEERDAAKAVPMENLLYKKTEITNEHQDFIDTVLVEVKTRTGYDATITPMRIYTTMDPEKQTVVNGVMSGETYEWRNEKIQGGIAVVDVSDGSLVAVGASRDSGQLVNNYATFTGDLVPRQPGSLAKPIIDYGPAIEYLGWSPANTVIDEEYAYTGGLSIKNWDNRFKGIMTAKTALASSRNIPALYTFKQTTSEQKKTFANSLGWNVLDDGNGNVLETCSIGGWNGISPVQAAAAYSTFARGGMYIEPYSYTKVEIISSGETFEVTPKRSVAMTEETAYLINVILKYAVTSGSVVTGSVKGTDIAGKTGTSTLSQATKEAIGVAKKKDVIGDAWEVAYSPDYAIATWYGYETPSKDYYLTSTNHASIERKKITKVLTAGIMNKNSRFKQPSGIVEVEVELETDPLELASPYTPEKLRSKEYFKEGTEPTTVSTRFSQLENPSNLRYSSTSNSVTLSWSPAPTPNAIDSAWLDTYFSNNVYNDWKEDYLQKRLDYNNKNIGSFGYHVYLVNESGTKDLGFTTSTTFTTNVTFDTNTRFVVKSSYQKFKDNQSNGIYVTVAPNSQTQDAPEPVDTTNKATYAIEYIGPSCSTVDDFNALGNKAKDKIKVTSNGENVTNNATISYSCYDAEDNEINCNSLDNTKEYDVLFTIRYNGSTRNKRISLKTTC